MIVMVVVVNRLIENQPEANLLHESASMIASMKNHCKLRAIPKLTVFING